MARQKDIDDLVFYAIIAGGGYITYKFALDGKLGLSLQLVAQQIQRALNIKELPPLPGEDKGKGKCSIAATGNISWMRASDPNFDAHVTEWKAASGNPYDWESFRQHERRITGTNGANGFDPGSNPPPSFCK